jgi:hypothetical protein
VPPLSTVAFGATGNLSILNHTGIMLFTPSHPASRILLFADCEPATNISNTDASRGFPFLKELEFQKSQKLIVSVYQLFELEHEDSDIDIAFFK